MSPNEIKTVEDYLNLPVWPVLSWHAPYAGGLMKFHLG